MSESNLLSAYMPKRVSVSTPTQESFGKRYGGVASCLQGNNVFDLTGPKFEPQTSRSVNKRVTILASDQYAI